MHVAELSTLNTRHHLIMEIPSGGAVCGEGGVAQLSHAYWCLKGSFKSLVGHGTAEPTHELDLHEVFVLAILINLH